MDKPRAARTNHQIDEYCASYKICFRRELEAFKHLHVGMIFPIKRKTLPEIAKVVGLDQNSHPILTTSPWKKRTEKRKVRFNFTNFKKEENFILMKQEIKRREEEIMSIGNI